MNPEEQLSHPDFYARMVDPVVLGKQIAERRGIWQMRFLNARKLSRLCKDRAVGVDVFGKDVEYSGNWAYCEQTWW